MEDSITFKESKRTGRLYFQFDSDKPFAHMDIFDYGEVSFTLKQEEKIITQQLTAKQEGVSELFLVGNEETAIEWYDGEGKRFKIFIKPIEDEDKTD